MWSFYLSNFRQQVYNKGTYYLKLETKKWNTIRVWYFINNRIIDISEFISLLEMVEEDCTQFILYLSKEDSTRYLVGKFTTSYTS